MKNPSLVNESIRYLVVRMMVGDRKKVDALYMYYVLGKSPSDIESEIGFDRYSLRGAIKYVKGNLTHEQLSAMLSAIYGDLLKIPRIVSKSRMGYVCNICKKRLLNPEPHIMSVHKNLVRQYVAEIVRRLNGWYDEYGKTSSPQGNNGKRT